MADTATIRPDGCLSTENICEHGRQDDDYLPIDESLIDYDDGCEDDE